VKYDHQNNKHINGYLSLESRGHIINDNDNAMTLSRQTREIMLRMSTCSCIVMLFIRKVLLLLPSFDHFFPRKVTYLDGGINLASFSFYLAYRLKLLSVEGVCLDK
jgi:hypothetical protein